MWRKALGPRCSLLQIVREKGGEEGVGVGNHTSCSHASAGNKSKTPTLPWSGEEKYAFVRLDVTKDQPAGGGGHRGYIQLGFHRKKKLI